VGLAHEPPPTRADAPAATRPVVPRPGQRAIVLGPDRFTTDGRRAIQEADPDLAMYLDTGWTDPADDIEYRRLPGETAEEWERRISDQIR
jgi:hypothetical protein